MRKLAISITYSYIFHTVSVILDVISIVYFIWSAFFLDTPLILLELALGAYFTAEYILLFIASDNRWKYIKHPLAISNILIIIGYLVAPFWNLGFLRILRSFRIIHLYQLIPDIRMFTKRTILWEKLSTTFVHVCVLTFIITEVVYIQQADINADINTRFDAFYFTTNAITKVGSGETIELVGVHGQIITLIIAVLSLSVFVQLLDTAKEVQLLRQERKKKKQNNENDYLAMDEIYSEQICTYCDIKNRENMRQKTEDEQKHPTVMNTGKKN